MSSRRKSSDTQITKKAKRKVGAPRGNTNALKHGFYSAALKKQGPIGVPRAVVMDFRGEVVVIKDLIFRLYKQGFSSEDPNLTVSCLRAISWASIALCRLVQTHDHFMPLQDVNPYVAGMQMDVIEKFKDVTDRLLGRKSTVIPRSLAGLPDLPDLPEDEDFAQDGELEPEDEPEPMVEQKPDSVPPPPSIPLPPPLVPPIPGCHPDAFREPIWYRPPYDPEKGCWPPAIRDDFGLTRDIDFDPVSEF